MLRDWTPRQPAIEFEQLHQLSDIAGIYKFPDEPGLDRVSIQHKIWAHYDTATDPEILAGRIKQFGAALGNHAITSQEIQANDNLSQTFVKFVKDREHEELTRILEQIKGYQP